MAMFEYDNYSETTGITCLSAYFPQALHILCGTFNSPQLLQDDGIGSKFVFMLAARCIRERAWDLRLLGTGIF